MSAEIVEEWSTTIDLSARRLLLSVRACELLDTVVDSFASAAFDDAIVVLCDQCLTEYNGQPLEEGLFSAFENRGGQCDIVQVQTDNDVLRVLCVSREEVASSASSSLDLATAE